VEGCTTGADALERVKKAFPDLIVLDLMLPNIDGLDVCRLLKRNGKTGHIPIVILTARGEDADIVTGLELGADDYITKPFSPRVLVARIRAVLRRKRNLSEEGAGILKINDLLIDPARYEVLSHGRAVELTVTEFAILHLLARRPGWVFTRSQIITNVKGEYYPVTDRSVDVQIVGLRKKLGLASKHIETVRGVGYRFRA
jgi:two-component system phosphate regulon response regulator PhoB